MTDLERLQKFQALKELINGPEAEEFLNYWDGRFFTGNMTFIFDRTPYNLYFYKGAVVDVQIGVPAEGFYVGIRGTQAQWDEFSPTETSSWPSLSNTANIPLSSWEARWPTVRTIPLSRRSCG